MRRLVLTLSAPLFILGAAFPASAQQDPIAELVSLMPEVSYQQMHSDLTIYAEAQGISLEEAAWEALEDAKGSLSSNETPGEAAFRSAGVERNLSLIPSNNRGDIFVTPASSLGYDHGHTGIYFNVHEVIEAPGKKGEHTHSRRTNIDDVPVASGAEILNVTIEQERKDAVADWADANLLGRPYNINFAANKVGSFSTLNCSQLVWHAYKVAADLDLDSNGGAGVYPYNIKDSEHTETYHVITG